MLWLWARTRNCKEDLQKPKLFHEISNKRKGFRAFKEYEQY